VSPVSRRARCACVALPRYLVYGQRVRLAVAVPVSCGASGRRCARVERYAVPSAVAVPALVVRPLYGKLLALGPQA
jgi:hypothetical protein